jgi:hypothetical protein
MSTYFFLPKHEEWIFEMLKRNIYVEQMASGSWRVAKKKRRVIVVSSERVNMLWNLDVRSRHQATLGFSCINLTGHTSVRQASARYLRHAAAQLIDARAAKVQWRRE